MDLRAKLGRLRSSSQAAASQADASGDAAAPLALAPLQEELDAGKAERIARLRALINEVSARDQRRTQVSARADGAASRAFPSVATAHGTLHVIERWLEPDHHHGRAPLRAALQTQPGTLAVLTRAAASDDLDLTRALYLDTETTGLAGGTGTVAFLVGLGRFEQGVLCLEQLIVPNLGDEAPVLARLAERIAAASCVVTYNGKSFDWPLLRTRFVMSRLPVPALPLHIDLLHAARSLWKQRFDSLRLTEVEREVLSFTREHDIPGSEIPARYFQFLRDGQTDRLAPVLEHNQNDLIALAALLGVMITRFEGVESVCDAQDALAFGRLALRVRASESALSCARAALAASTSNHATHTALLFESTVQRQVGDHARAVALIEQALTLVVEPTARAALHFSLTKLYEHELDELVAAWRHARHTELVEGPIAQGRRLGRLHRRLLRRQPPNGHDTATREGPDGARGEQSGAS
jgi:uncharacterized protein YprB with RNaseH-like and TPR domain